MTCERPSRAVLEAPASAARGRAFAIGDIHGCAHALDALLDRIAPTNDDRLYFLGDYVDRGPDSRGVLDRLVALGARVPCVFLRGNHDVALLLVSRGDRRVSMRTYLSPGFGGARTLESYGATDVHDLALPPEHEEFLEALEPLALVERAGRRLVLTHAGVDPEQALGGQRPDDLIWGPRGFRAWLEVGAPVAGGPWEQIGMVFGHYRRAEGFRLHAGVQGIDTGAGSMPGGRLSALDLDAGELLSVPAPA